MATVAFDNQTSDNAFGDGYVRLNSPVRNMERINASFNDLIATAKKYAKPGAFERTNEYFKNMKSKDVNDPDFNIKEEVAKARWEKYASIT